MRFDKVRIAVVGCGPDGVRWAQGIKQHGAEVVWFDADVAKAAAAAQALGVHACETVAELFAAEPDGIVLATPELDAELALQALDALVRVMVTSLPAIDAAGGLAVARRAQELGRFAFVSAPEQVRLADAWRRVGDGRNSLGTVTGVTLVRQCEDDDPSRLLERFGAAGAIALDALLPLAQAERVRATVDEQWCAVVIDCGDLRGEYRLVSAGAEREVLRVEGTRRELVVPLGPAQPRPWWHRAPRSRIVAANGRGRRKKAPMSADEAFDRHVRLWLETMLNVSFRPPLDMARALTIRSVVEAAERSLAAGDPGVVTRPI